ncbi:MAG: iron ABC transporter permease [Clostridia bacterium]|nr:iron ABC transporter permease [Clostridia bacterium]
MKNSLKLQKATAVIIFIAVAIILVFFIICPLVTIFSRSIITDGKLDWTNIKQLISESEYLETIRNSLLLGLTVTLLSTVISFPLAFIFSRTRFAKAKWMDIVFMIPFMTPPYIAAMGWQRFLSKRGFLWQFALILTGDMNSALCQYLLTATSEWLYSFWGLAVIMTFNVFPFMFTLLKNAMANIPSSLDEAAAVSGGNFFYRLRKVYIPLLVSNYAIAAILVFVKTISEYGTPSVLGNGITFMGTSGFYVFTTKIQYFATVNLNFGMAATLSAVLTIICFVLWLIQMTITKKTSYKLQSGKGVRVTLKKMPVWASVLAIIYIVFILLLAIGVPYFSVITTSLMDKLSDGIVNWDNYSFGWGNLTLSNYANMFTANDGGGGNAILISLMLALISATLASVLGMVICTLTRRRNRCYKTLEAVGMIPEMLPAIVLVIGMMIFWNTSIYNVIPIYRTLAIMVVAYVALFLPYSIQYISSAYTQFNDSLPLAGRTTGGSKSYVFLRITLPLIGKGVITGWMMIFIISFRELVAASLLQPPNTYVISTYIYSLFNQGYNGATQQAMCLAVICLAITVTALILINVTTGRKKKSHR